MQSWLYQMGVDEGEARAEARREAGQAEGELKYTRQICADLVREYHPGSAAALLPAVEACEELETLRSWAVQCVKLPDRAFGLLVTSTKPARSDLAWPRAVRAWPRSPGKVPSPVDTDRPLKTLFERQGQSLLQFIGEHRSGVRVTAVDAVELPAPKRTIDSVLRLERDGLFWYRHLEFQAERDPGIPRRCFEYNSRLILHYDAPVFTTVLYLLPGADRDVPDAFRLYVGDWLAYEWRFDVVRLWEIDVEAALSSSEAGPLALVPLLRGGDDLSRVLEAVRKLDAMPRPKATDAISALLGLVAQRYDRATFLNVLGKDRAMQSWLWQMGADEGEAKGEARGEARGRAEGELKNARQVCADLVRELHPGTAATLLPAVEACEEPETLRSWAVQCARLSDHALVVLVTGKRPARVARARANRPSRRASAKRR
jgi:predicted transposase YdaD